jgi:hypothetical protein
MSKLSLGAAILLLSSTWMLGRVSTLAIGENSASTTQSSEQADRAETATIEGCLSSNVDAFVLTAANGRTYALTGDTAQLTERVGNQVRVSGHADRTADAELTIAGGAHAVFGVEKIQSLSASCK